MPITDDLECDTVIAQVSFFSIWLMKCPSVSTCHQSTNTYQIKTISIDANLLEIKLNLKTNHLDGQVCLQGLARSANFRRDCLYLI